MAIIFILECFILGEVKPYILISISFLFNILFRMKITFFDDKPWYGD